MNIIHPSPDFATVATPRFKDRGSRNPTPPTIVPKTENRDRGSQPETFKLKAITMRSASYSDVQKIAERWEEDGGNVPKTASAYRMRDAADRGDLEWFCEHEPLLVAALQNMRKTKKRLPLKISDSDSKIPEKDSEELKEGPSEEKIEEMIAALFEITGCDPKIKRNGPKLRRVARDLASAGYAAADVRVWYQRVWLADWRGKRGDLPELQNVEALIGRVRLLPKVPEPAATDTPSPIAERGAGGEGDPQAGAEPTPLREAERGLEGEDNPDAQIADLAQEPEPRPELTFQEGGAARNWWEATLGQLKIQLNRSTFETHLRDIRLVEVDKTGEIHRFIATVPHHYPQDFLNKHVRASMTRTLDSMYNAEAARFSQGVEIIIRTQDEDLAIVAEQKARAADAAPGV